MLGACSVPSAAPTLCHLMDRALPGSVRGVLWPQSSSCWVTRGSDFDPAASDIQGAQEPSGILTVGPIAKVL